MNVTGLPRDARVLLLGTGHESARAALLLISRGHRGKIVALSENGQLPADLPPELAASLHEVVAWHRLQLKAGRVLGTRILKKGPNVRGIRVEYFSHELGTEAKLECDVILGEA